MTGEPPEWHACVTDVDGDTFTAELGLPPWTKAELDEIYARARERHREFMKPFG